MNFKVYTLQELATIKYGKSQKKVVSDNGDIPIYGTGGLMGYAIQSLYDKPSVLIGRKGTIDRVHYVTQPFWTVDTLFYTEINNSIVLPHYLYYLLSILDLKQYNEGTTIPSLRTETLNRLEFNIPSIKNQQKILAILEPLEYKIELNNKINKNLEQQAQAIFIKEFLCFDVIPDTWKESSLINIANYLNGLAMQKFRPNENKNSLPVLKIRELRQGFCDNSSDLCSANIQPKYIIKNGDVIFSWSGSLLIDFWCGEICGLNQHLFKVTSNTYDKWFYYLWTKHHIEQFTIIAMDKATTMGHIKRNDIEKAKVIIPPKEDYLRIGAILQPIYDIIIQNRLENNKLSLLKDTLLPKLMSGEIDASKINV